MDSYIHIPNATSTIQDVAPVTIRSDPAVSSDRLVDVREAKRTLKTVFAQKLYYPCAKGNLPFISKQSLAMIKAEYLARDEIEMDDWSAIILLDNQAQFQNMDSQFRAVLDENKKMSGKIKDSVRTVQVNSILEAFIHGLGKGLPYSITALVLGILYYVYISTYVDYQRVEYFVSAYKNAPDYVALIREG